MHDIRAIRENPEQFDRDLKRLSYPPQADKLIAIDAKRRQAILDSEAAQRERNELSKQAGLAKAKGNAAEFDRLRDLVTNQKDKLVKFHAQVEKHQAALNEALLEIPNLPMPDVPDGEDERANVELHRWGQPKNFDFTPLEHFQIKAVEKSMDFATAARLSGARFVVLYGPLAQIHRALSQFMIDMHVNRHGLTEVWPPVLVKNDTMQGTGQLPKFAADLYRTEDDLWLIPTAEVALTNLVKDLIVAQDSLPRRYCAHTQCFRSEAGAAGRDTAGMLRQHQFEKVEMVSITTPSESEVEQKRMLNCAEAILQALEMPYRCVSLCTGDLGFGARRTFDLEVWLPGQNRYREISSVSTCGDFQARRMKARFRPTNDGAPQFLHTLNGSGLAVGRSLIAILENGQQVDGSVNLPAALHRYLNDKTRITPEGQFDN